LRPRYEIQPIPAKISPIAISTQAKPPLMPVLVENELPTAENGLFAGDGPSLCAWGVVLAGAWVVAGVVVAGADDFFFRCVVCFFTGAGGVFDCASAAPLD